MLHGTVLEILMYALYTVPLKPLVIIFPGGFNLKVCSEWKNTGFEAEFYLRLAPLTCLANGEAVQTAKQY